MVSLDKAWENSGLINFKHTPWKIKKCITFKFCELYPILITQCQEEPQKHKSMMNHFYSVKLSILVII